MSIRILLADDHKIVREGLRSMLEKRSDMEVIGEARDGREAVRAARDQAPDVVVMDVEMPGLSGIEATRQIAAERPEVKVLCLSMHRDRRWVLPILDAGGAGYLIKDCALEELARAIRAVTAGQTYLSPAVAGSVVEAYRAGGSGAPSEDSLLTAREREVLQLLAEGHSSKEIASRLHLSPKTVGTYRERLMRKLDIHNVAGLVKYAIREGLTTADRDLAG